MMKIRRRFGKNDEDKRRSIERTERLDNEETDIEDVLFKEAIDMICFRGVWEDKFNRQFESSLLIYHGYNG